MQPIPSRVPSAAELQAIMVGRLKEGDEFVIRDILVIFGPIVAGVLGRDYPQLAGYIDDIIAEALHRLWEKRDVYDPTRSPLRRWFYIIAQHVAIDLLKSNWQKSRQVETRSNEEEVENAVGDNGEITEEVDSLSKEEKDILNIFESFSIIDQKILSAQANSVEGENWAADLSGEIGMKPGTIRVRLGRLHEKIEKEMLRRGHNLTRVRRRETRTIPIENTSDSREGSL